MNLASLYIENFRSITTCDIAPSAGVNTIVGDNACGKTSVLEAIYLLGRGQSFRQNRVPHAIQRGTGSFTLRARMQGESDRSERIGCHASRGRVEFKLNDQATTRRYDLISALPLQHIDPNVHRLLEQGPQHRRHFLDWGVFHVEQAFFPAWRRYRRALKQRNQALRNQRAKHEIIVWDTELVEQGEIVDACRRRYLDLVRQQLPENASRLIGEDTLAIDYEPGWKGDDGYGRALLTSLEADIKARFTQNGPHRADIRIRVASIRARDWVSRGQQKMLTAGLLLAQVHILHELRGIRPVLLIDDMTAELGESFRDTLAEEIRRSEAQSFITFLDKTLIPQVFRDQPMFHVEQGTVHA